MKLREPHVRAEHLWWSKTCFHGRHCCRLITFVSRVQLSHMIFWEFIWWGFGAAFSNHNRKVWSRFDIFQTPVVKNAKRTNVIHPCVKNKSCFMNLVLLFRTFCVALWSVRAPSLSSCWIAEHWVLWGWWNIKKAVCDLTIGSGPWHATRKNPGQDRLDFNGQVNAMPTFFPSPNHFLAISAIKSFLVFYQCTTCVAGSLIEISERQYLYTFHWRDWLLFLAFALWCATEQGAQAAQAAIFLIQLHFVVGMWK